MVFSHFITFPIHLKSFWLRISNPFEIIKKNWNLSIYWSIQTPIKVFSNIFVTCYRTIINESSTEKRWSPTKDGTSLGLLFKDFLTNPSVCVRVIGHSTLYVSTICIHIKMSSVYQIIVCIMFVALMSWHRSILKRNIIFNLVIGFLISWV